MEIRPLQTETTNLMVQSASVPLMINGMPALMQVKPVLDMNYEVASNQAKFPVAQQFNQNVSVQPQLATPVHIPNIQVCQPLTIPTSRSTSNQNPVCGSPLVTKVSPDSSPSKIGSRCRKQVHTIREDPDDDIIMLDMDEESEEEQLKEEDRKITKKVKTKKSVNSDKSGDRPAICQITDVRSVGQEKSADEFSGLHLVSNTATKTTGNTGIISKNALDWSDMKPEPVMPDPSSGPVPVALCVNTHNKTAPSVILQGLQDKIVLPESGEVKVLTAQKHAPMLGNINDAAKDGPKAKRLREIHSYPCPASSDKNSTEQQPVQSYSPKSGRTADNALKQAFRSRQQRVTKAKRKFIMKKMVSILPQDESKNELLTSTAAEKITTVAVLKPVVPISSISEIQKPGQQQGNSSGNLTSQSSSNIVQSLKLEWLNPSIRKKEVKPDPPKNYTFESITEPLAPVDDLMKRFTELPLTPSFVNVSSKPHYVPSCEPTRLSWRKRLGSEGTFQNWYRFYDEAGIDFNSDDSMDIEEFNIGECIKSEDRKKEEIRTPDKETRTPVSIELIDNNEEKNVATNEGPTNALIKTEIKIQDRVGKKDFPNRFSKKRSPNRPPKCIGGSLMAEALGTVVLSDSSSSTEQSTDSESDTLDVVPVKSLAPTKCPASVKRVQIKHTAKLTNSKERKICKASRGCYVVLERLGRLQNGVSYSEMVRKHLINLKVCSTRCRKRHIKHTFNCPD